MRMATRRIERREAEELANARSKRDQILKAAKQHFGEPQGEVSRATGPPTGPCRSCGRPTGMARDSDGGYECSACWLGMREPGRRLLDSYPRSIDR